MSATKSIVEFTGRRITFKSPLSFAEVSARLEKELNKPGGGPAVFRILGTSKTKEEIEAGINALTGGRDFVYFGEVVHNRWLKAYTGAPVPGTAVYTFGNPLIAQTMLQYDLAAGLHIPPKLLLLENADGSGTRIIYDDPSSHIPVPSGETGEGLDDELKKAAEALSAKVEALVAVVLG
ncbi:TT1751-like protein [Lenzites betulinus]|nr:TT1751-like protein [Lenzites betulinus]